MQTDYVVCGDAYGVGLRLTSGESVYAAPQSQSDCDGGYGVGVGVDSRSYERETRDGQRTRYGVVFVFWLPSSFCSFF